jgi:hypothetical protein
VLEGITLAEMVEFVVQVFVNLSGGTILDEKAAKNSETTHPENLAVRRYTVSTHDLCDSQNPHPLFPSCRPINPPIQTSTS